MTKGIRTHKKHLGKLLTDTKSSKSKVYRLSICPLTCCACAWARRAHSAACNAPHRHRRVTSGTSQLLKDYVKSHARMWFAKGKKTQRHSSIFTFSEAHRAATSAAIDSPTKFLADAENPLETQSWTDFQNPLSGDKSSGIRKKLVLKLNQGHHRA